MRGTCIKCGDKAMHSASYYCEKCIEKFVNKS